MFVDWDCKVSLLSGDHGYMRHARSDIAHVRIFVISCVSSDVGLDHGYSLLRRGFSTLVPS